MRFFDIDLVDVVEGRGPAPVLVIAAVQALPDYSLTAALSAGGRDHYGWGVDRHLLANLYDAINLNTRACGNWGKGKAPKLDPFPRPKSKSQNAPEKKKVSAREALLRMIGKG